MYLLIEELKTPFAVAEMAEDILKIGHVRDFVSHPLCGNQRLCLFVREHLPDAVTETDKLVAKFDRTKISHRNFVGQYLPRATEIARALVDAAVEGIR